MLQNITDSPFSVHTGAIRTYVASNIAILVALPVAFITEDIYMQLVIAKIEVLRAILAVSQQGLRNGRI